MCTAINFRNYFGRNMDYERSFDEWVVITPRNFVFPYVRVAQRIPHYAIIGIATVVSGYPLYYDGMNEFGLAMAGLSFPDYAVYYPEKTDADNITPFEFIPWILGQCKTTKDAKSLLKKINLLNIPFSKEYPLTPLHWIIADKSESIVVETMPNGMQIYDNPVGVLTNAPNFQFHLENLNNYLNLTAAEAKNRFSDEITLNAYSRGMGAIGLPGDLSSSSRFVRAAFTKLNSQWSNFDLENISQFFHVLCSVYQQNGCAQVGQDYEKTLYSSCCDMERGIYYYTTYYNSQITAVNMHKEDLDSDKIVQYPIRNSQQIYFENM